MSYIFFITILLVVFFLIGASALTAFNTAALSLGKFQTKESLKKSNFFLSNFFLTSWDRFYTTISVTKHLLYLLYAISLFFLFLLIFPNVEMHKSPLIFLFAAITIFIFLFLDFILRFFAKSFTNTTLIITSLISSIYLIFFLPISFLVLILVKFFFKKPKEEKPLKTFVSKDKVLEMIKDSELSTVLTINDQNIIASAITFKEKTAREIMIPRVDIFALNSKTTIKETTEFLISEDYSRIPVYQDSLDNIIGVLMYKDLLKIFSKMKDNKLSELEPISSIVKPVIYAPENIKIPKLFQQFKNEKIHIAIIVNEYGGTEGIVTIEDILEELVGEIKDEYDITEEKQFWQLPTGSFVVDAKMSIIDLEENLNIKIPHSVEYETIGGFIFHRAGTIPQKGWILHLDDYDIEVLISNERCIEKIRIQKHK